MTPAEQARIDVAEAAREGAVEAYDRMRAERDAALDALHRVRQALGLGGVLGRPETIAESAERRAERESASAAWEALCVRAAGWVGRGPEAMRREPEDEAYALDRAMDVRLPISDRVTTGSIYSLALFARLMAIMSRPS